MRRETQCVLAFLFVVVMALCVGLLLWPQYTAANTSEEFGWLRVEQFGAVSTGTTGSSTMSATSKDFVRGHIYAVNVDWSALATDATSDITLTATSPAQTILVNADSVTDEWFYPSVAQTVPADGSARTAYDRMPINSRITAAVAQSTLVTTENVVTVTVYWGQ